MKENRTGWSFTEEQKDTSNQYSLETVVSRLVPEEVETEAKSIRLERVLFDKEDPSPIYRRAMRLVSEEEWKAKRKRYKQPPYLTMVFLKKDRYEDEIKTLLNQDLFLKESVDLREYFSPIQEPQKGMTCTAHAGKALMEYFQNRASKRNDRLLSWRFLYKVTRDLMAVDATDESRKGGGATLRDTLKSMVLFGVPPAHSDKNWLAIEEFDEKKEGIDKQNWLTLEESGSSTGIKQPSAFAYAYAQNFQASKYFRLDKLREIYEQGFLTIDNEEKNPETKLKNDNEVGQLTVAQIRIALASGFPSIFGVRDIRLLELPKKERATDTSLAKKDGNESEKIKLSQVIIPKFYKDIKDEQKIINEQKKLKKPNPSASGDNEVKKIGHALVAVGYDDNLEFVNPLDEEKPFIGGFLFRDSQGKKWGDDGYGWMPYDYVENGLATDWWSLLDAEWINTSGFGISTDQILGCLCASRGCPPRPNCL